MLRYYSRSAVWVSRLWPCLLPHWDSGAVQRLCLPGWCWALPAWSHPSRQAASFCRGSPGQRAGTESKRLLGSGGAALEGSEQLAHSWHPARVGNCCFFASPHPLLVSSNTFEMPPLSAEKLQSMLFSRLLLFVDFFGSSSAVGNITHLCCTSLPFFFFFLPSYWFPCYVIAGCHWLIGL